MAGVSRRVAAAALVVVSVTACSWGASGGESSPGAAPAGVLTEGAAAAPIAVPEPAGAGRLAGTTPGKTSPKAAPAQAGAGLRGQAVPTNQWWSSAVTGPLSQPIWARPLAVRVADGGIQVSGEPPAASANAVVTPFTPVVTVGGPVSALTVIRYGAFHVVLRAELRGGGAVEATLVQGSPVLYLRFVGVDPSVAVRGGSPAGDGSAVQVDVAGRRWDLVAAGDGRWRRDGDRLTATGAAGGRIALARAPDGADGAQWSAAVAGSAAAPVVETTATMAYDAAAGTVTQTLTARRDGGGPGVWALLPHQAAGLVDGTRALAGTYPDAVGPLSIVEAAAVRVRVPMPGLLTGVPRVPLSGAARAAVLADLDRDLADPPGAGGSYFGLKELGRLATIAEVAAAVGAADRRTAALDRLRPQLVDWLVYGGGRDGRYFSYDRTWGGLIAVPAEFGSSDYNDHHFQYGYLVRAAAVLAQADPAFLRDYGPTVDLVARDYAGGLAAKGPGGLPPFRVFNPYLGHSAASGFAPFADGNNQESSSEAVAAWEALARWGAVRRSGELVTSGVTHYALEAATARAYWLGEGVDRPAGYAHRVAGIVWDAKVDYATFFDPRPESVQGIQLLPLTIGSLYRSDPGQASARAAELERAVGGAPRIWADLFAADFAVAESGAARDRLRPDLPREPSTSRAMVRFWVELLGAYGPPQAGVVADGPYGLAFGSRDKPVLVAVNPTAEPRTVRFRASGEVVAELAVEPGGTAVRR